MRCVGLMFQMSRDPVPGQASTERKNVFTDMFDLGRFAMLIEILVH